MKFLKPLGIAACALLALGFLAAPSAQAGTRVSVNIGGGGYCGPRYYPRPVAYCPPAYYPAPVVYQPVYYPRPAYYSAPVYRPAPGYGYGYGYARPVYYQPGCR